MTKILVVDDDDVYGELTVQRLELAGYEADFQHGPFGAALYGARTGAYDVVIVDVNMPGLSGTALLELIKKGKTRAKVILCSSMDEDALSQLAANHGADHFFSKSATADDLVQRVRALTPPRTK